MIEAICWGATAVKRGPLVALRQYLAADKHQFMAKIIREPRLVIRMSGPLLAVLDAKSSRNRPHLGHAAFVCFGSRSD